MSLFNYLPVGWIFGFGPPINSNSENQFYLDIDSYDFYCYQNQNWIKLGNANGLLTLPKKIQLFDDYVLGYNSSGSNSLVWGNTYTTGGTIGRALYDATTPNIIGYSRFTTSIVPNALIKTNKNPILIYDLVNFNPKINFKATYESELLFKSFDNTTDSGFIGMLITTGVIDPDGCDPYSNNYQHFGLSINSSSSINNLSFSQKLTSFLNGTNDLISIEPVVNDKVFKVKIEVETYSSNPDLLTLRFFINDKKIKETNINSNNTGLALGLNISARSSSISTYQIYFDWDKLTIERKE